MSNILQKQIGVLPALVSLVLNTETLIAYTGRCEAPAPTLRSIVKGWTNITMGASALSITIRIRRGNGITGTVLVVGGSSSLPPLISSDFSLVAVETLQNVEYADYSLTAQQVSATGNGVLSLGTIEVELING